MAESKNGSGTKPKLILITSLLILLLALTLTLALALALELALSSSLYQGSFKGRNLETGPCLHQICVGAVYLVSGTQPCLRRKRNRPEEAKRSPLNLDFNLPPSIKKSRFNSDRKDDPHSKHHPTMLGRSAFEAPPTMLGLSTFEAPPNDARPILIHPKSPTRKEYNP